MLLKCAILLPKISRIMEMGMECTVLVYQQTNLVIKWLGGEVCWLKLEQNQFVAHRAGMKVGKVSAPDRKYSLMYISAIKIFWSKTYFVFCFNRKYRLNSPFDWVLMAESRSFWTVSRNVANMRLTESNSDSNLVQTLTSSSNTGKVV